jgi:predicted NBD/HSP70 family sugar kinase
MILSIDVGIRNLAMCLLNETNNLVEEWDVSGVPPEHKDGIYVSLRKHLDERPC